MTEGSEASPRAWLAIYRLFNFFKTARLVLFYKKVQEQFLFEDFTQRVVQG